MNQSVNRQIYNLLNNNASSISSANNISIREVNENNNLNEDPYSYKNNSVQANNPVEPGNSNNVLTQNLRNESTENLPSQLRRSRTNQWYNNNNQNDPTLPNRLNLRPIVRAKNPRSAAVQLARMNPQPVNNAQNTRGLNMNLNMSNNISFLNNNNYENIKRSATYRRAAFNAARTARTRPNYPAVDPGQRRGGRRQAKTRRRRNYKK